MSVTVQNVLGHALTIRTDSSSERRACTEAIRRAESAYPAQGWMVLRVL